MRIDIWSDVVCPWCYIGKRRLEQALERRGGDDVEIVWHSYQLDPGAPRESTESVAESLGRKYGGGPDAGRRMIDQVEAVAAEEGLLFRLHDAQRASTVDAHRLLHLALEEGGPRTQSALKEALLAAYFTRAENPSDHAVLRAAAVAAGLPAERVEAVLSSDEYADAVEADVERAHELGAQGVPFFVIDGRVAVPGAQPVETFLKAFEQARPAPMPVVVDASGEVCGPEGCD